MAQVRYRQQPQPCTVLVDPRDGSLQVGFADTQRAVAPGQSVVLYEADTCLGGAVIARTDAPLECEGTPPAATPHGEPAHAGEGVAA